MSKVTGKLQVTLPKRLATAYGIHVGDEVEFSAAGDRISLQLMQPNRVDCERRLRLFDVATERQRARERARPIKAARERGWRREDLYGRGRTG